MSKSNGGQSMNCKKIVIVLLISIMGVSWNLFAAKQDKRWERIFLPSLDHFKGDELEFFQAATDFYSKIQSGELLDAAVYIMPGRTEGDYYPAIKSKLDSVTYFHLAYISQIPGNESRIVAVNRLVFSTEVEVVPVSATLFFDRWTKTDLGFKVEPDIRIEKIVPFEQITN